VPTARSRRVAVGAFVLAVGVDAVLAVRWDEPPADRARDQGVVAVADVRDLRPGTAPPRGDADATATRGPADVALDLAAGGEVDVPTSTTASAAAPTTTVAAARVPTIQPGPLRVPAAGSYPIRFTGSGRSTDGTLVIDDDQWQRRSIGSEVRSVQQLSWGDRGAVLAASGEPGADGSCRWEGPAVAVPSDLRDGRTWSSRTTCRSEVAGAPVRVVRREQAQVTKRARTQVGGRTVDSWVIDREVALTIEAETFTTTSVSISTELFAPELGLAVYQTSRTDVPMPDGTIRSSYASEELLAVSPRGS
jgi:hypothetical protein